ncbi:hypothetical protein DPX16_12330, partial [Anabarilius grahami]
GNPVSGGVTLIHTECEGKHSYEVKGFLNQNKGMFTSKGDKLLMINNTNVEDLTPKAFAGLLVEGPPLLTIHHPCKIKTEECESEELCVNKKEPTVISFSLMMVRESELEACADQELSPSQKEWEDWDIEDDCCDDGNLLIVSMADTSFSMVVARGSDPDNPCSDCGKTNCQFNEVVVLPAKAEITSSSSKNLEPYKEINLFIKSFMGEKYVSSNLPKHRICLNNTMSEPITIYYYAQKHYPGCPVVLNFTNTENFFSCTTKQDNTKILTVVQCRKTDLKKICPDDPQKWSLVFYMSTGGDNIRRFESALHRGWFIYTKNVEKCEVDVNTDGQSDYNVSNTFFIIIQSG